MKREFQQELRDGVRQLKRVWIGWKARISDQACSSLRLLFSERVPVCVYYKFPERSLIFTYLFLGDLWEIFSSTALVF